MRPATSTASPTPRTLSTPRSVVVAAGAGRVIRREPLRHADVPLRVPRGLLGDGEVDTGALRDEARDVVDVGFAQPQRADAGADRGQQVGVARCAEHPDGALGRLFERFEQHVGGALDHAVGILHDDHAVAPERRREVGALDERAGVLDRDDHAFGAQRGQVGVRAGEHLPHGVLVARLGDQRGGEGVRRASSARIRAGR